jgi:Tat protein secretion system quality control protein TatD with DNase activity
MIMVATAAAAAAAAASSLLAFDAHNHIQLGPTPKLSSAPSSSTTTTTTSNNRCLSEYMRNELNGCLCGMAPMSTHPRDFQPLLDLEKEMNNNNNNNHDGNGNGNGNNVMKIIPCLGVHPWFIHELEQDDWDMVPSSSSSSSSSSSRCKIVAIRDHDCDNNNHDENENDDIENILPSSSVIIQQQQQQQKQKQQEEITMVPKWIANLEKYVIHNPHVPVGEIGLDGFHFDFDTKELTTPMEKQIDAFRYQLQVATKYHRSVSVHCVRAMGKIMDTINDVATTNNNNIHMNMNMNMNNDDDDDYDDSSDNGQPLLLLPPRIYFHAFGGKAATAIQLIRTIEKIKPSKNKKNKNNKKKIKNNNQTSKVYFGFAPVINLNSHSCSKTIDVIRAVGIHRLVLETDHEDIQNIQSSMELGIDIISNALDCTPEELIRITNNNVNDLYNISI